MDDLRLGCWASSDSRARRSRFARLPTLPPRLPIEKLDELGDPAERRLSPRVALHPSLLLYDLVADDGAYVGVNHDGTVGTLDVELEDHVAGHEQNWEVVVQRQHRVGHVERNWREYW